MAKLSKSLNTDLPSLAKMLERKGRGKDTVLAHITPKEAEILHKAGGRGSKNPDTGLLEFEGGFEWFSPSTWGEGLSNAFSGAADTVGGWFGGGGGEAPASAPAPAVQETFMPSFNFPGESAVSGAGANYLSSGFESKPISTAEQFGGQLAGMPSSFPTQVSGAANLPDVSQYTGATADLTAPAKTGASPGMLKSLGLTGGDLLKLGLAGGLGAYGMTQANKAAKQGQAQTAQMQQIAQPYQTQGQSMAGAALRGELTPQSQQAYQAMQAQLKQGVESRGGVGAMQSAQALESFRNQLLTNQYQYGIQVANIGDQIALGAIKTGMQLDQNLSAATQSFYGNLANVVGGTWRTA